MTTWTTIAWGLLIGLGAVAGSWLGLAFWNGVERWRFRARLRYGREVVARRYALLEALTADRTPYEAAEQVLSCSRTAR